MKFIKGREVDCFTVSNGVLKRKCRHLPLASVALVRKPEPTYCAISISLSLVLSAARHLPSAI